MGRKLYSNVKSCSNMHGTPVLEFVKQCARTGGVRVNKYEKYVHALAILS